MERVSGVRWEVPWHILCVWWMVPGVWREVSRVHMLHRV